MEKSYILWLICSSATIPWCCVTHVGKLTVNYVVNWYYYCNNKESYCAVTLGNQIAKTRISIVVISMLSMSSLWCVTWAHTYMSCHSWYCASMYLILLNAIKPYASRQQLLQRLLCGYLTSKAFFQNICYINLKKFQISLFHYSQPLFVLFWPHIPRSLL